MKKAMLLTLFITGILFANKISFKDFSSRINYSIVRNYPIIKEYKAETGATNKSILIDLKNVLRNKYFKKALYNFYFNNKLYTINYFKKPRKIYFPDLKKVLKELSIATTETKNPIAAFFGLNIIEINYMNTGPAPLARKYIKYFTGPLMKRNYCIGYLYGGRSYFKEFSNIPNYSLAYKIFSKGLKKCNKKESPKYTYKWLREYNAKAYVLKRIWK